MSTKKTKKRFTVGAKISLDTDVEIYADNMEEAITIARGFDIHNFVSFDGGHNDSSLDINSIYENGS
jgi:hypothetical protein